MTAPDEKAMLPAASLTTVPVRRARPAPAAAVPGAAPSAPAPSPTPTAPGYAGPPPMARSIAAPVGADPAALIAWWQRLKGVGIYPSPADLDQAAIRATWPEAVLLDYDPAKQAIARASRLGGTDLAIEYTPMVTEWLLELGRRAARGGAPLHETRDFPVTRGRTAYDLVALPLSADRRAADRVLCRLGRRA
jgi:hypothetical protein